MTENRHNNLNIVSMLVYLTIFVQSAAKIYSLFSAVLISRSRSYNCLFAIKLFYCFIQKQILLCMSQRGLATGMFISLILLTFASNSFRPSVAYVLFWITSSNLFENNVIVCEFDSAKSRFACLWLVIWTLDWQVNIDQSCFNTKIFIDLAFVSLLNTKRCN